MRALIVDDSRCMREFLAQHLRKLGVQCLEAKDGRVALDLLKEDDAFDLMLVDVNMPVMGGLECVRSLRAQGLASRAKVMMVTTEADHSFIEQALDYGADDFLMKPFTAQSMRAKLILLGFKMAA